MKNGSQGQQPDFFEELSGVFSEERLNRYLGENNPKKQAVLLYTWNIELSKSLYPSVQILEVTMRNSLHNALSDYFQTDHWFDDGFLSQSERLTVSQAKEKLSKNGKQLTPGRLVAELSFGFWTSLFDIRYEHGQTLWPKLLTSVLPFMPRGQRTRRNISRQLNEIRKLRNRIFHYEPIWYWGNLCEQHQNIANVINWLSPVAHEYLKLVDDFVSVYKEGQSKIASKLSHKF